MKLATTASLSSHGLVQFKILPCARSTATEQIVVALAQMPV
jgi:hypothetical protein